MTKAILMTLDEINIIASMCGINKLYGFLNNSEQNDVNTYYQVFYLIKKGYLYFQDNHGKYTLNVCDEIKETFHIVKNAEKIIECSYDKSTLLCGYIKDNCVSVLEQNKVNPLKIRVRLLNIDEFIRYLEDENILPDKENIFGINGRMRDIHKGISYKTQLSYEQIMKKEAVFKFIEPSVGNTVGIIVTGWHRGRDIIAYSKEFDSKDKLDFYEYNSDIFKMFVKEVMC